MTFEGLMSEVEVLEWRGTRDLQVTGLAYDSRHVMPGNVFCTWRGLGVDGHRFIPQAIAKGAKALVIEDSSIEIDESVSVAVVNSTRKSLGLMADRWFESPQSKLHTIGVTGTNGKTSTASLIHYIWSKLGNSAGLLGTIETRMKNESFPAERTTPESLDLHETFSRMTEEGCDHMVMEVSSHALKLERVSGVNFQVAVFTNLTQDHLDFHSDMEDYFLSKKLLFDGLSENSVAVINQDDCYGQRLLKSVPQGVKVISYGVSEDCTYQISNIALGNKGTTFDLSIRGESVSVSTPWLGDFNVLNTVAAIAAVHEKGIDLSLILKVVENANPVAGRLEFIECEEDFTVLVDYAHTPDALKNVLTTLRPLCEEGAKLRVLIGCGGDRDRAKRPLMAQAACELADEVVFASDNPRAEDPSQILNDMVGGVEGFSNWKLIEDRSVAIENFVESLNSKDIGLIAGKGHENYQEINGVKYPFSDFAEARKHLKGVSS